MFDPCLGDRVIELGRSECFFKTKVRGRITQRYVNNDNF